MGFFPYDQENYGVDGAIVQGDMHTPGKKRNHGIS